MVATVGVKPGADELYSSLDSLDRVVSALGSNAVAGVLGVAKSQPTRWRQRRDGISPTNRQRLTDLDHVLARLLLVLHPEEAGDWLSSSNAHLAGGRPIDVLHLRGAAPVIDAIDAMQEGAFA